MDKAGIMYKAKKNNNKKNSQMEKTEESNALVQGSIL